MGQGVTGQGATVSPCPVHVTPCPVNVMPCPKVVTPYPVIINQCCTYYPSTSMWRSYTLYCVWMCVCVCGCTTVLVFWQLITRHPLNRFREVLYPFYFPGIFRTVLCFGSLLWIYEVSDGPKLQTENQPHRTTTAATSKGSGSCQTREEFKKSCRWVWGNDNKDLA